MSKRQQSKRKLPRADDTRPRDGGDKPRPPKSGCQCKNHMGTAKIAHKTEAEALEHALVQVRKGRTARIYRCPTSDRLHVATARMKR